MAKNLSEKKRAIYTGLHPFLNTDNLMEALVLWEQKYSDSPAFAVQHFINDICSAHDLKTIRRDMLLSLVKTLALPEEDLMPDPSVQMSGYKKLHHKASTVEYTTRELIALQRLVIAMMEQAKIDVRISIKEFVLDQVSRSKIDSQLKRELQLWLSKQSLSMKVLAPDIEDIRKVINFFYVGFCEYLGPVETDRLLSKCVAKLTDNQTNDYTDVVRALL